MRSLLDDGPYSGLPLDALDAAAEVAGDLAFLGAALDVLALVVVLLAAGQAQLDLEAAVLEVQLQRDEGVLAVADLARQRIDLGPVQQKLAGPARGVVGPVAVGVLRDVQAAEPHLAVVDGGEGVVERRLALAQRLDLGADQHDTALPRVQDRVIVAGAAVGRDHRILVLRVLRVLRLLLGHNPSQPSRAAARPQSPPCYGRISSRPSYAIGDGFRYFRIRAPFTTVAAFPARRSPMTAREAGVTDPMTDEKRHWRGHGAVHGHHREKTRRRR